MKHYSKTTPSSDSIKNFLNEAAGLKRALEEEEIHHQERLKKVPDKVYHATPKQNTKDILKEGLDPSKLIFENKEVVGLSDDIDFALKVAAKTQKTSQDKLTLLEIDTNYLTPSRIQNYLRKVDPEEPDPVKSAAIHEIHYESTIPPEAIKIKNRKNLEQNPEREE